MSGHTANPTVDSQRVSEGSSSRLRAGLRWQFAASSVDHRKCLESRLIQVYVKLV